MEGVGRDARLLGNKGYVPPRPEVPIFTLPSSTDTTGTNLISTSEITATSDASTLSETSVASTTASDTTTENTDIEISINFVSSTKVLGHCGLVYIVSIVSVLLL